MVQGGENFGKTLLKFVICGVFAVGTRRLIEVKTEKLGRPSSRRYIPLFILLIGTIFLQQPWKHLTSTLLYDVVSSVSTAIVTSNLQRECSNTGVGRNPLRSFNYNPSDDPYYISNLDSPIDPFIESALEGTEFKNIVHIVLESMRGDSYPWNEKGILHKHIHRNFRLVEGGTPITTSNITPFINGVS